MVPSFFPIHMSFKIRIIKAKTYNIIGYDVYDLQNTAYLKSTNIGQTSLLMH